MLSVVKILAAVAYYPTVALYAIAQMAVVQADGQVGLTGKPSIGGAQIIAVLGFQTAVALHDILRIQIVEVRVEIVDTGARQPFAIFQTERLRLSQLQVYFQRGHHVGIMARVVSVCPDGARQILDVLISIFIAQPGHYRDHLSTVSITQIAAQDVVPVLIVVAPQVIVRPFRALTLAVIQVVLALVVAQYVLSAHLERMLLAQRSRKVILERMLIGLVPTV